MKYRIIATAFFMLLITLSRFPHAFADTDHSFLSSYEGSKTCRACHESAVTDLTHALHYRMLGQVQGVYDMFTNKPVTGEKGKGNRY
jgi:hypothetical protein